MAVWGNLERLRVSPTPSNGGELFCRLGKLFILTADSAPLIINQLIDLQYF